MITRSQVLKTPKSNASPLRAKDMNKTPSYLKPTQASNNKSKIPTFKSPYPHEILKNPLENYLEHSDRKETPISIKSPQNKCEKLRHKVSAEKLKMYTGSTESNGQIPYSSQTDGSLRTHNIIEMGKLRKELHKENSSPIILSVPKTNNTSAKPFKDQSDKTPIIFGAVHMNFCNTQNKNDMCPTENKIKNSNPIKKQHNDQANCENSATKQTIITSNPSIDRYPEMIPKFERFKTAKNPSFNIRYDQKNEFQQSMKNNTGSNDETTQTYDEIVNVTPQMPTNKSNEQLEGVKSSQKRFLNNQINIFKENNDNTGSNNRFKPIETKSTGIKMGVNAIHELTPFPKKIPTTEVSKKSNFNQHSEDKNILIQNNSPFKFKNNFQSKNGGNPLLNTNDKETGNKPFIDEINNDNNINNMIMKSPNTTFIVNTNTPTLIGREMGLQKPKINPNINLNINQHNKLNSANKSTTNDVNKEKDNINNKEAVNTKEKSIQQIKKEPSNNIKICRDQWRDRMYDQIANVELSPFGYRGENVLESLDYPVDDEFLRDISLDEDKPPPLPPRLFYSTKIVNSQRICNLRPTENGMHNCKFPIKRSMSHSDILHLQQFQKKLRKEELDMLDKNSENPAEEDFDDPLISETGEKSIQDGDVIKPKKRKSVIHKIRKSLSSMINKKTPKRAKSSDRNTQPLNGETDEP